jgi:hypothetical protein
VSRRTTVVGSLDLLAGRARAGDRRAAAQLRRRMTPQVRDLARALSADPRVVPVIVRQALSDALADDRRPYTSALVAAVQRRSAAGRTTPGRRAERTAESRLLAAVGVLCDMQGHTHQSAASLLGEPVERVAALHAQGRSDLGVDGARTSCRGWHLVSRLDELTPPEQEAGRRHLAVCRRCEEALAARAAARLRVKAALPVGGTVIGGGIVALFAAVGGGSAGVGAAAVGAAAVLGTAGTVAVAVPPAPPLPPPTPAAPAETDGREVEPRERTAPTPAAVDTSGDPAVAPAPAVPTGSAAGDRGGAAGTPAAPSPAPSTTPPASPPPAPLPSELPQPLPTELPSPTPLPLPGPTSVPLPLPTAVPVPLPTLGVELRGGCQVVLDEARAEQLPREGKDGVPASKGPRCEVAPPAEQEGGVVPAEDAPAGVAVDVAPEPAPGTDALPQDDA